MRSQRSNVKHGTIQLFLNDESRLLESPLYRDTGACLSIYKSNFTESITLCIMADLKSVNQKNPDKLFVNSKLILMNLI